MPEQYTQEDVAIRERRPDLFEDVVSSVHVIELGRRPVPIHARPDVLRDVSGEEGAGGFALFGNPYFEKEIEAILERNKWHFIRAWFIRAFAVVSACMKGR